MRKIFLGLFIVSLVFFVSCRSQVDFEKYRVKTIKVEYAGSAVINSVEMRMLKLNGSHDPGGLSEQTIYSNVWFLYPAERVPENITGKKVELVYRIKQAFPIIIEVINIKILN